MQVYNSTVVSVLLYGAETWALTRTQEKKLDGFDSRSLRRIMGIRWQQRVSNEELRRRTKQPPVTSLLKKKRLRWLGHTMRMEESRIAGDDLGGRGEKEAGTTKDHMATDDQQRPGRHADQHAGCEGAGPEQGGVEKLSVCLMRRMAQEEISISK